MKLVLRSAFRRLMLLMKQVTVAQQFACSKPIVEDHEQSPATSFRQIKRDRKQPARHLSVPKRLFPDPILLDSVSQMPAPVKEAEHLRAVCENLDLSVRSQYQADVAPAQRRAIMRLVAPGAGHGKRQFGERM